MANETIPPQEQRLAFRYMIEVSVPGVGAISLSYGQAKEFQEILRIATAPFDKVEQQQREQQAAQGQEQAPEVVEKEVATPDNPQ